MLIKNAKFLVLLLVFTLCGCSFSHYTEPENRIYSTALGIDKTTSGYLLTCETADSSSASLAVGEVFTATKETLPLAFLELKAAMHKTADFSKCPVVFVGENITGKALYETVSFLLNQNDFAFSVRLVSTQNANRLLNAKTKFNLPKGVLAYETLKKAKEKGDSLAVILNKNQFVLPEIAEANGVLRITTTKKYKDFINAYE